MTNININKNTTLQMNEWKGQFGNDYIARNAFADWKLKQGITVFKRIMGNLDIGSLLEVGSNIGLNLTFINEIYGGKIKLNAVEPNKKAYDLLCLNPRINLSGAWNCSGFEIPVPDQSMDLVFTSGVLIHVAPEDLRIITDEIVRISKKYVLCIEYFSHNPVEVPYHGQKGLLFKRDFGAFYAEHYPDLECVDYGFLWQNEFSIFDNLNWWLFEKNVQS